MKKKHLKKLQAAARQLPPVDFKQMVGRIVTGRELQAMEDVTSKPDDIDVEEKYRVVKPESAQLNHYKKLKKSFKVAGFQGAAQYCNAVVNYTKQNKKIEQ